MKGARGVVGFELVAGSSTAGFAKSANPFAQDDSGKQAKARTKTTATATATATAKTNTGVLRLRAARFAQDDGEN
jgi:hypothetical protein